MCQVIIIKIIKIIALNPYKHKRLNYEIYSDIINDSFLFQSKIVMFVRMLTRIFRPQGSVTGASY